MKGRFVLTHALDEENPDELAAKLVKTEFKLELTTKV